MSTTVVAPLLARPTTPKIITLAITHDVICPWCYVAWREIKRAIIRCQQENLPVNFQIQFKPYKLDCTLPTDNCLDKQERYISKFGKDRYMGILKVLEERGKNVEINFNFTGSVRQTLLAHRLLLYAYKVGGQEAQLRLIEEIFRGFFELAEDIGDMDTLAKYCEKTRLMTKDIAINFLKSDMMAPELEREIATSKREGISGVPFTVINDKWAISGGQSSDVFFEIFSKLAKV